MTTASSILPIGETIRRTTADHALLAHRVEDPEKTLDAPYRVAGGPLGDFCESLRDLVAHVLMWEEISLAMLTEARHGRAHWSLDSRWETAEAGRRLNLSGVVAGREVPIELLLHRFTAVGGSLIDELSHYDDDGWKAPLSIASSPANSIGELAQYAMTIPDNAPYWHAAIHLGALNAQGDLDDRSGDEESR